MYSIRKTITSEGADGTRELQVIRCITADEARELFGKQNVYDDSGEVVESLESILDDGIPDIKVAESSKDTKLTSAVAAMAAAIACLMEPVEASALNEAASALMEGGDDGDA